MQLLDAVRNAWGWAGVEPHELIDDNHFGNLIIKDVHGQYWRLCPEDLRCEVVASSQEELDRLGKDQEFLSDLACCVLGNAHPVRCLGFRSDF